MHEDAADEQNRTRELVKIQSRGNTYGLMSLIILVKRAVVHEGTIKKQDSMNGEEYSVVMTIQFGTFALHVFVCAV